MKYKKEKKKLRVEQPDSFRVKAFFWSGLTLKALQPPARGESCLCGVSGVCRWWVDLFSLDSGQLSPSSAEPSSLQQSTCRAARWCWCWGSSPRTSSSGRSPQCSGSKASWVNAEPMLMVIWPMIGRYTRLASHPCPLHLRSDVRWLHALSSSDSPIMSVCCCSWVEYDLVLIRFILFWKLTDVWKWF